MFQMCALALFEFLFFISFNRIIRQIHRRELRMNSLLVAENHRTQTQYNDSLIVKLFAFQFVNTYTSLFYIAFFRGVRSQCRISLLNAPYLLT